MIFRVTLFSFREISELNSMTLLFVIRNLSIVYLLVTFKIMINDI